MDPVITGAVAILVVWGVLTFLVNNAPGFTHILLIAGVSLLIWGVVRKDAPAGTQPPPQR